MSRIVTGQEIHRKASPVAPRGSAKEKAYLAWLHLNGTCCVTGQPAFDLAHTGDQRHGKGMSRKADAGTMLPLIRALHSIAEGSDRMFWPTVGLPDYIEKAQDLFAAFERGEMPDAILAEMQSRVDRAYVAALLGEIDY